MKINSMNKKNIKRSYNNKLMIIYNNMNMINNNYKKLIIYPHFIQKEI